jgi:hypothetical protein
MFKLVKMANHSILYQEYISILLFLPITLDLRLSYLFLETFLYYEISQYAYSVLCYTVLKYQFFKSMYCVNY